MAGSLLLLFLKGNFYMVLIKPLKLLRMMHFMDLAKHQDDQFNNKGKQVLCFKTTRK